MPQRWIIAYDVADPKRLRRVAKHLEGVGTRLQNSVFECGPLAWREGKLRAELREHVELQHDALSYYAQCVACGEKSAWQGMGETPEERPAPIANPGHPVAVAGQARSQRLTPPAFWLV